jgi:hypothetical protein
LHVPFPLHTRTLIFPAALASVSVGFVLVRVQVRKQPKPISKGIKAAAAEAAVTAAEAISVADLEEANRLAAEFEAFGGGAFTMALAQEAEPGDLLRECWLAHGRPRVRNPLDQSRGNLDGPRGRCSRGG